MKRNLNKNIIGFISLLFMLVIFSNHVLADDGFDENKDISLTIELKKEGIVLQNVNFDIYKIASVDKDGITSLEKEFEKYPIEGLDTNDWNDYALTLKTYIVKDKIQALLQEKTNESGIFKTDIKPGLYLIIGNQASLENHTYKINPYLLLLPEYDQKNKEWKYELSSYPKILKEDKDSKSKKITKIWNDSGNENQRPESIEVEVFANKESYELVRLSESNNWQHTLLDLDSNLDWTVTERDIKGGNYRVKVKEEGDTFIIENTYTGKKTEEKPQKKPSLRPKELPNTGQLWWPVFFLVAGGIIFILLGLVLNKRKGSK